LVAEDVSVAVSVAVLPNDAVPATLLMLAAAPLTTRSPETLLGMYRMLPGKLATTPPVSVPAVSLVTTPVSVATAGVPL
jgi:hypothetical protein